MNNINKGIDNVIIVDVLCKCLYTLKYFFKEEFYIKEENVYVIPTEKLLAMKRQLLPLIVEGSGERCDKNDYSYNCCDPHKFKKCLEDIYQFLENSVVEEEVFYNAIKFFPDKENQTFFGWSHIPIKQKCIKHLSYMQRIRQLNSFF